VALSNQPVRAEAKQKVTLMTSVQAPAPIKAENLTTAKAIEEEKAGNVVSAKAMSLPPPPSAPATMSPPASEAGAMKKASVESQPGPATLGTTNPSIAVGGSPGVGQAETAAAKAPSAPVATSIVHAEAQASAPALRASLKTTGDETALPATLWRISSNGKVQRSTDGGKIFEEVQVAPGVNLRAITTLGKNVWAGGSGGALFHSADAGATWNRLDVESGGSIITETIVGIQLLDGLHLIVTFANSELWISNDGGRQWQKKP
jgi:hypothetical protein